MNPNMNKIMNKTIPFNDCMKAHACHVWEHYIEPSGFESLLVLAHSAGGGSLIAI